MKVLDLTNINFYILAVISVINAGIVCLVGSKFFQIMQLSGYKLSGYNAWLKDTKIKFVGRIIMLTFLSLFSMLITNVLLDGFGEYYSYLGLIFYVYFSVIFIINMSKMPQKTPLKQTRRMNRLIITTSILMAIVTFFLMAISTEYLSPVKYSIISFTPLLMPIFVPIATIINAPIESLIRNGYIKRAKNKLKKMPNLIKIGITGSYGKTTTKHILNVMLSKKYSVCMTPHSFNTPMGLTKVVLKYLKRDHEILIAEMGARHVGDIKYLCDLIKPKHAIITAVASQHLLTFGSLENIAKTKNELVLAVEDGVVVFNGNSEGALNLYNECNKDKYLAGINVDGAYCNATDINYDENGSSFNLTIDGMVVFCKTKLLGLSSIEDISLAATMAYKLGVSVEKISEAIGELEPMSHRLEIVNNKNGFTIIDNSYNSSVESSKMALDTISAFKSKNKIIVTPGIVEMGDKEYEVNFELGRQIAGVCTKAVIINKVNLDALKNGLLSANFNENDIICADNLKDATEMFGSLAGPGDVILFENDLPDNYT